MSEEEIRQIIREELMGFLGFDKFVFTKPIQVLDARNFQFGKSNGTKFGTEGGASGQKMSVFNANPVVQGATISDPAGGGTQDAEARTAIDALIDRLEAFGIIIST